MSKFYNFHKNLRCFVLNSVKFGYFTPVNFTKLHPKFSKNINYVQYIKIQTYAS